MYLFASMEIGKQSTSHCQRGIALIQRMSNLCCIIIIVVVVLLLSPPCVLVIDLEFLFSQSERRPSDVTI
nr:hypothetical protein CFP56_75133 [Quercus suber]